MIKECEIYHGMVFSHLLRIRDHEFALRALPDYGNLAYVVNNKFVLYIKYSTKRMSPWNFSFSSRHHRDLINLHQEYGKLVVALVCGHDGIVTMNFDEIQQVLGIATEKIACISCSRKRREMYSVKGSVGELQTKIGDNHFIEKLLVKEIGKK